MSNPISDRPSLLSLIVDLSPVQWAISGSDQESPLSLSPFLSQLLAFLNAHLAGKAENTLAVFGALPGRAVTVYTSTDGVGSERGSDAPEPTPDANSYQPFKVVYSAVVTRIVAELDALSDYEEEQPPALVGALTKALCYINRIVSAAGDDPSAPEARILVLSISPDASMAYVPIMNAIFSAQKLKVSIDVAQLFGPPTTFLQQAAHLTGGAYIHLTKRDALLQYLIMSFLPPPSLRTLLAVPSQRSIDLRASCFCHRRVVDIGCVCSVCLSIFCQPVPVCTTCRTKFPMKTLQRLKASYPQPAPASAPGSAPGTPGVPRTPAGGPPVASQGNPSLPTARNMA